MRYCIACETEYHDWVTECADCGEPLTNVAPVEAEHDAAPGRVSLDGIGDDQLAIILNALSGDRVPFARAGNELLVPAAAAGATMELVSSFARTPRRAEEPQECEPRSRTRRPSRGRGRRLFAAWIDGAIVTTALLVTGRRGSMPAWLIASFLLVVPATALFGWTPGKRLVKLHVVTNTRGRPPGLVLSSLRWLIPVGPTMLIRSLDLPPILAFVCLAVLYAPILTDDAQRGLHDRACGTLVKRA